MKQVLYSWLLISVVINSSCKKTVVNPVSSNLTSSVLLVDANDRVLTDFSGTTVSIENSNPQVSVTTDAKGDFELPGFTPSGTTGLVFSHPGYGVVKSYYTASLLDSIKAGLFSLQSEVLLPKSSVLVNSFAGTLDGNIYRMTINVSVANSNATNGVSIFVQKNNPALSFSTFIGQTDESRIFTIPVTDGNNNATLCLTCTEECSFLHAGDTVYLKAYGDIKSVFSTAYVDFAAGRLVLPGLNPDTYSATISFVMP